jgi:serine/threonine protein kinase
MAREISIGDVIAGYRVDAVAGRGGMGVVYRAYDQDLERVVALKVIAPALAGSADFRARFKRESRTAASIRNPNVITIYRAGEEDGRGLVNRDVKPANVLLTHDRDRPHVYLTDFGLTKAIDSDEGLTRSGTLLGTLDYIAPEQIMGEAIDARTDVYALGCVLFHMLTGRVPYPVPDMAKVVAHTREPPPSVLAAAPHVPPAFEAVIGRAAAKNPEHRYPSAGDLGRAAVAAAAGDAVTVEERSVATGRAAPTTSPAGPAPPPTPAASAPMVAAGATRRRGRRRALLATGAALISVAAIGTAAFVVIDDQPARKAHTRQATVPDLNEGTTVPDLNAPASQRGR